MKTEYIGTPAGMNALLRVDKEISKLENLYIEKPDKNKPLSIQAQLLGKDGEPINPNEHIVKFITKKE